MTSFFYCRSFFLTEAILLVPLLLFPPLQWHQRPLLLATTSEKVQESKEVMGEMADSQDLREGRDFHQMVEKAISATVTIYSRKTNLLGESIIYASGALISSDGKIITCNHLVEGTKKLIVETEEDRYFSAHLVGRDPETDLAVLKIEASSPLPYIKLGDSQKVRVGDIALALGSPLNYKRSVTRGIVSGLRINETITEIGEYIQTDALITEGSSGGPLINLKGEIIGINIAASHVEPHAGAIGFAITSKIVKNVVDQISTYGKVRRCKVGVIGTKLLGEKKFHIKTVEPGSLGDKIGLKEDDFILEFLGHPVRSSKALETWVSLMKPNDEIVFKILRGRYYLLLKGRVFLEKERDREDLLF